MVTSAKSRARAPASCATSIYYSVCNVRLGGLLIVAEQFSSLESRDEVLLTWHCFILELLCCLSALITSSQLPHPCVLRIALDFTLHLQRYSPWDPSGDSVALPIHSRRATGVPHEYV